MRAALVLGLVLCARAVGATTYYVDYVGGSDANDGTCAPEVNGPCVAPHGPWKTPPGAACIGEAVSPCSVIDTGSHAGWAQITHGDSILFHAGQRFPLELRMDRTWYQGLIGSAGATTTLDRYGTGADPVFDAGGDPTRMGEPGASAGWTKVAGQQRTYAIPLDCAGRFNHVAAGGGTNDDAQPLRSNDGGRHWYRWTKGGTTANGGTLSGSNTACTDAGVVVGGMYQDCASKRLCIGSADDPTTDQWHLSWRAYLLWLRGPRNLTIQHVATFGKAYVGQGTEFGGAIHTEHDLDENDLTINAVTVEWPAGAGVRITHDGVENLRFTLTNSVIHDAYVYGLESVNASVAAPSHYEITGNDIAFSGDHGISLGAANAPTIAGNHVHHNGIGPVGCGKMTPTAHCAFAGGLTGYGSGIALGARSSGFNRDATITGNEAYHNGEGCRLDQTINSQCGGDCNAACSGLYLDSVQGTNLIANNMSYFNWGATIALNTPANMQDSVFTIVYNTGFNDRVAGLFDYQGGLPANHFTVQNNQFVAQGITTEWYNIFWKSPFAQLAFDHNNVYDSTRASHQYFCNGTAQAGPCPGWAGTSVDPEFVSPSDPGTDLRLKPGSPAVDTGVSTAPGVTVDYFTTGRPVGAASDVGAHEWTAGAAPSTTSTSIAVVPPTSTTSTTAPTPGPTTTTVILMQITVTSQTIMGPNGPIAQTAAAVPPQPPTTVPRKAGTHRHRRATRRHAH